MRTKAIIIKKQATNEFDELVICYTEDFGKLLAVAKSILKPSSIQALHLDIFNLVEFELINGRGIPIITGAQAISSYPGIKNSLVKTAIAYFFAEVVDKMVFENDKDEKLWSFLVSFAEELNKANVSPTSLFRKGQRDLLSILGYLPEVDSCKTCGSGINTDTFGAFNHLVGGIICKECFLSGQGGILISNDDFNMISGLAQGFEERNYRKSVLDGMFEYISGGKFSSLELLGMLR